MLKTGLLITIIAKSKITGNYVAIIETNGVTASPFKVTTVLPETEAEFIIKNSMSQREETDNHTIYNFATLETIKP